MKHATKEKGDLGVLKALASVGEQGYKVLLPVSEHMPFDLVAYKDGKFYTIQVKFRKAKNGVITVKTASNWTDKHGVHSIPMNKELVDILCIYCPDTDKCYYIRTSDVENNISLRIASTKNGQLKNINIAENYLTF